MSEQHALDCHVVLRWAELSLASLDGARTQLNAANVFPVADSDTGTNMFLTLRAGLDALRAHDEGDEVAGGESMGAFARGALLGARGNSGIIMSEYLRGFSVALREGAGGAACLHEAAQAAYNSVAFPVQGTILTAADSAAAAAREAEDAGGTLPMVLGAACAGARRALTRSPRDLDVLARNGVRDAGAYGLTLIIDALASALNETLSARAAVRPESMPDLYVGEADAASGSASSDSAPGQPAHAPAPERADAALAPSPYLHAHSHDDGEFEVMFLLERATDTPSEHVAHDLRDGLARIGASVVVVGGDGMWQAHVHTDDPAAALASVREGTLRQVCVRHLADVHDDGAHLRPPGLVVGTGCPGLIADMARAGAVVLVSTEQGWRPDEIARAIIDAGTERVIVLAPSGAPAASARALGHAVGQVRVDVLETPTDLHAVVALTASAELLDAVPSASGHPARSGPQHLEVMAEAIKGLGVTVEFDCAGEAAAVSDEEAAPEATTAPTDDPALAAIFAELRAQVRPGPLGLALVLHGNLTPAAHVEALAAAMGSEFGQGETVTLSSGCPDARVRIGML